MKAIDGNMEVIHSKCIEQEHWNSEAKHTKNALNSDFPENTTRKHWKMP